jgi:hypothetical protein
MKLYASSESNEVISALDDESRTLESYGAVDYNCIKVGHLLRVYS